MTTYKTKLPKHQQKPTPKYVDPVFYVCGYSNQDYPNITPEKLKFLHC